ncbi:hypothetical protein BSL78_09928 [Apostichopus japonicus]|uniref:Uncharacterized protein n=1 Tax=Stichopus japonicus TaxID=307972 RepID=A0A2G8KYX5_STIJA|nr:hypothetical protein BSL78_09928 [Apostichopus japonicus]
MKSKLVGTKPRYRSRSPRDQLGRDQTTQRLPAAHLQTPYPFRPVKSQTSTLQNLSGVLSSFVNQATTATSTLQQVRFSEDKDTFLDNLDFLDAKTVGQTAAPRCLWVSDSSAVLDAHHRKPSNSSVLGRISNAATNLLNNQPKLVVSTLAETISSLVNTSKASFMNKNPPAGEGKDDKRELNVGVSAIRGLQGQPEVAATLRVTSPVQQAPVQAARPEMIQSASLQNLNANSGVVSRPAITLTSEQIGIRAQQQLQQIQARIQQLMSRQVRSDIENRQLQQLLHYRQKVIVKVKAQLAQLSHQQRLANLSMGQQSRDKPGPVTPPSSQINVGAMSTPSSQINIGTVSTAAQVATKAGGAFSSLLVPHGQATGKNASTGLNVHVLAQSPQQQQQQQQQYSPSVSPAGVSGQKQIQNALITSTTSKQDTLKNVE